MPETEDPLAQVRTYDFRDLEFSADPGAKPEFAWIDKTWLYVDARYQRRGGTETSRNLIRTIVKEFNWAKFTPIIVSDLGHEDGKFAVLDGQHRVAGALLHPHIRDVPAWVVAAPELTDQADVFVDVNHNRSIVKPLQLHRARVAAGEPLAIQIEGVCVAAGVRIEFGLGSGRLRPGGTQAISTLRRLVEKYGTAPVQAALLALNEAYADVPDQLRSGVIEALVEFGDRYAERLDHAHLVRVLAERDCEKLNEAARSAKAVLGGSTKDGMIVALVAAYNKGLRQEKRLAGEKPLTPVAVAPPPPAPRYTTPPKADPGFDDLMAASNAIPLDQPLSRRCARCNCIFTAARIGEVVCGPCSKRKGRAG